VLYIVSEDKGSGFVFWCKVNEYLLNNSAKVVPAGGIPNLYKTVMGLPLQTSDTLFVAVDINDSGATTQLEDICVYAVSLGVEVLNTSYVCLEEVFLFFKSLRQWCSLDYPAELLTLYNKAVDLYKNNSFANLAGKLPIFSETETMFAKYFEASKPVNNVAQLFSRLLTLMTFRNFKNVQDCSATPDFTFSKGKIGDCWVDDCNHLPHFCEKCKCNLTSCQPKVCLTAAQKLNLLNLGSVKVPDIYNLIGLLSIINKPQQSTYLFGDHDN